MEVRQEEFLKERKEVLAFYSPYVFVRKIKAEEQFRLFVKPELEKYGTVEAHHQMRLTVEGQEFIFLYKHLSWDSQYFKRPCYKLYTVLYEHQNALALVKAVSVFKEELQRQAHCYCFAEIPAEDIFLIQCLNQAGLRLVETRLHYVKDDIATFTGERYAVREAGPEDTDTLAKVAATARNKFDRLHADYAFTDREADDYLGTYAAAAVNGFCDKVLVPEVEGLPVASFMAFDCFTNLTQGLTCARISLAAVGVENKGWFFKLLSEVIHHAKENKISYILYPTQATNRAATRVLESLGFRLGAGRHVLVFHG